MSVRGNSFAGSPTGAHISTSAGSAAALYSGAFTVMMLMRPANDQQGFFGGWTGGVGGTSRGGLLLVIAKLFGQGDFSSGFGGGYDSGIWRWLGYSKDAGSAHYVMHMGVLSTLAWSHGESSGAGNHADTGSSDAFSLGMNADYALGSNTCDMAAGAAWKAHLSPSAIEAACTKFAQDLVDSNPHAGWLMPEATAASPIQDFTGGGADETSRTSILTSTDPTDFDFTLSSGSSGQRFLPFF